MKKPTTIGSSPAVAVKERPASVTMAPPVQTGALVPLNTGSVKLSGESAVKLQEELGQLDFASMKPGEVSLIGSESERGLHETLDGFLQRLDHSTASQVFSIFSKLQKGVDDAKLPDLVEKIKHGDKPGMLTSIVGAIRFKKSADIAQDVHTALAQLVHERSSTLVDTTNKLELELKATMAKLLTELQSLDELKVAYGEHISDFAFDVALSNAFLEKARAYVAQQEQDPQNSDPQGQIRLAELRAKLQALESRALSLDGTYTKLPADQLVIQQIEQAGISTLQETASTAASRMASIKGTLLMIQGAMSVVGVQRLSDKQASLDQQLGEVRKTLTHDVVASAATAPGDNRIKQAEQIQKLIAEAQELKKIGDDARVVNQQKFEQARQMFSSMRQQMSDT